MFFILAVFSFLDIGAIYLTYSRSALLMLVVSLFVFLWFYGMKKYLAGVFVLLLIFLFFSPKSFQTEGTNIFRIASSEARIESAKTAIEIAQKQPLFGVGFNAYRYAQNRYGYLTDKKWGETHAGAGTDNIQSSAIQCQLVGIFFRIRPTENVLDFDRVHACIIT
jgi:O-antigen ligase